MTWTLIIAIVLASDPMPRHEPVAMHGFATLDDCRRAGARLTREMERAGGAAHWSCEPDEP